MDRKDQAAAVIQRNLSVGANEARELVCDMVEAELSRIIGADATTPIAAAHAIIETVMDSRMRMLANVQRMEHRRVQRWAQRHLMHAYRETYPLQRDPG